MLRNTLAAGVISQLLQSASGRFAPKGGPNLYAVPGLADPRFPSHTGKRVPLIGFYNDGHMTAVDKLCNFPEGGNFQPNNQYAQSPWSLGGKHQEHFYNAEAAFQALKFWSQGGKRYQFSIATGPGAFALKKAYAGMEDVNWKAYAGHGNNWKAMEHVVAFKFTVLNPWGPMQTALKATGNAFLVERNKKAGVDKVWSDNRNGDGTNWLGVLLMLQRDRLNKRSSDPNSWTAWLNANLDLNTGVAKPLNVRGNPRSLNFMVYKASKQFFKVHA